MTLPILERSVDDGKPVTFYEFTYGDTAWRWTDAAEALPFLAWTWQPIPIGRSTAKESEERGSRDLVVFVPRDNPLAAALVAGLIGVDVGVKVYTSHREQSESDLLWRGRVAGVAISGSEAEIRCAGINAYTDRLVPRLAISRTCPLMLYETQCGVDQEAFTFDATVVSVSGAQVTVSGAPELDPGSSFYVAGTLQFGSNVGFIEAQNADVFTLMNPVPLSPGLVVRVSAGCDRSFEVCRERFGNSRRFFGFKFLPVKNPFDGRFD